MTKLITISVTVLAEDSANGDDIAMAVHAGADSNIKAFCDAFDVEADCLEAELVSETPVDTDD